MNIISVEGRYKFELNQVVRYLHDARRWQVKHRYTERFEKNKVSAISRYVIWHSESNQLITVSEIVLRAS